MTFLIAYTIFEVPSNYFLKKASPSTWLAFLMFGFGALTMGIGGSQNFATIAVLRFFLGAFEAGEHHAACFAAVHVLTYANKVSSQDWSIMSRFGTDAMNVRSGWRSSSRLQHLPELLEEPLPTESAK